MSDDERETATRTVKVGGEEAQAILQIAMHVCDHDDASAMFELVNALTLAAVQLDVATDQIAQLIDTMRPVAEHVAGAITDAPEGRRFDA